MALNQKDWKRAIEAEVNCLKALLGHRLHQKAKKINRINYFSYSVSLNIDCSA